MPFPQIESHGGGSFALRFDRLDEDIRKLAEYVNGGLDERCLATNAVPVVKFRENTSIVPARAHMTQKGANPTYYLGGTVLVFPPEPSGIGHEVTAVSWSLEIVTGYASVFGSSRKIQLYKDGVQLGAAYDIPVSGKWIANKMHGVTSWAKGAGIAGAPGSVLHYAVDGTAGGLMGIANLSLVAALAAPHRA